MIIVDLTQFFPYAWIQHLIRAVICYNVINTMLPKKHNQIMSFFLTVIPLFCYSFITISKISTNSKTQECIFSLLYHLLIMVILLIFYDGTLKQKALATIFCYIGYIASVLIASLVLLSVPDIPEDIIYKTTISLPMYLTELSGILFASFIPIAILHIFAKHKSIAELKNNKYLIFFLFPISHIFFVFYQYYLINITNSNNQVVDNTIKKIYIVSQILLTICFLLDFSILFSINHISDLEKKGEKNDDLIMKNQIYFDSIQILKNEIDSFKKIKHDYLNVCSTAIGYLNLGNSEKAIEILQSNAEKIMEFTQYNICKNETINTILTVKSGEARKKNISLKAQYNGDADIVVNDFDLCRLLTNLIDNAIEATEYADGNELEIEFFADKNELTISTKNPYKTTTRKKSSANHGFGIKIIKDIAKKYNGRYTYECLEDKFYTLTILENNIDTI